MPIKLTPQQELAVHKKGNILVAAAAGSGKTAVLVERVITKLCSKTDPVRADRLLIVTFTNAAATEMRGRIEKRLDEECRKNPDDTGLLLQKHLLSTAKICTIDSFCIDFVRENFEKLGISPDFTISDNITLKPINERVLGELLNEYFEAKDPLFMELLDIAGAEFDEGKFSELILGMYDYSRQLPFPEKWFNSLVNDYNCGIFDEHNPWRIFAIKTALKTVNALRENLANAVDLVGVDEKMADKFLPCFIVASEQLNGLYEACETGKWDTVFNKLNSFSVPSMPIVRGSNDIPEVKAAKDIYDNIKTKGMEGLYKFFYGDEAFINSQFKKLYNPIKLLTEILREFSSRVYNAYLQENTFTFHNTEALALNLLCNEKNGEVTINPEAVEFLELFEEVCVDEYQDTNDLQNMLFYVLSNRDSKLFAVGDVKQSIYGFRGANPEHFLEKKNSHIICKEAKDGDPLKIILGNNFRSRPEICSFINYFFQNFMTAHTGSIVYDEEEMLIPSGIFPDCTCHSVSMDIIENTTDEAGKTAEARQIARFIKSTMSGGAVIRETEDTLRNARFSDFTILLRTMKNNAGIIAEELRKQGIPVNFSAEGFCEYTEIAVMLSLLKVIDNPCSDIELLSVMMSPIFGFSAEEMAKLRINSREGNLYSAVTFSAESGDKKAEKFLKTIQKYRLYAVTNTLPRLLNILYEETGFLNTVLAYTDGNRRRNNLLLLIQYAEGFSLGNGTISGFVDYILKQSEKGIKSSGAVGGEDCVKIMSIHASKGLQFPVCIIANTATAFNNSESRVGSVYSSKYGLGFKYFDEADKKPYTTLSREVILARTKLERLEEELRLLYVAMTRAQDILHFTAVATNLEKKVQETAGKLLGSNNVISSNYWCRTKSYFEWLLTALMLHPDGKELRHNRGCAVCQKTDSRIKLNILDSCQIPEYTNDEIIKNPAVKSELLTAVKGNFQYRYPFEELFSIQSKASVSVLANKGESEKYIFSSRPSFMSKDGITATGKGTAMHKVMEFFDFSKWEKPEEEIERLTEWQFISDSEANSVNITALKNFFASNIFARIIKSKTVKREMRFLTELPVSTVDQRIGHNFKDENIIVQGAVDICFAEDDGIVILDFKTDRTDNPQSLTDAYGEQLNIYGKACEKIFNMPVKEKIIYSFSLSKEIKL